VNGVAVDRGEDDGNSAGSPEFLAAADTGMAVEWRETGRVLPAAWVEPLYLLSVAEAVARGRGRIGSGRGASLGGSCKTCSCASRWRYWHRGPPWK